MAEWPRGVSAKVWMAVIGGSAVVAMGGVTVAFDDGVPVDSSPVAAPILPGPMTQGDTVTTTIPPTTLATAKAVVTHKAQPYKG
ncbi:hypothetical protein [Mycolicibacterium pallens]|uniref:Uncharacterized protein n=1 Tax=Mycolicibacterium pallens TaxID=370524 RepID=A0ABX8VIW8_9MYCO|nr:hypothetical protein [Mycolicibacterium pallens]QYL17647.1 hypothetical protein K0O64_03480 [Mycolicibacterium pallens]